MNFSLTVAFRYLYGKKTTNAINVITAISVIGIAIGTAALILILSVFNGFEGLMKSNLDAFNPDYKVTSPEGKYFKVAPDVLENLRSSDEIQNFSLVLEELALIEYDGQQQIGIIKGVDQQYLATTNLDQKITDGEASFYDTQVGNTAVIGVGISYNLNIGIKNRLNSMKIYVPNRKKKFPADKDFRSRPLTVSGVFQIENERDNQYVISNYEVVAEMLALSGQYSAIEIRANPEVSESELVGALHKAGLENYTISDRLAQDASFLKITNIEKWTSYFIFTFVLILITFNLVGCLWMIVLEKRKDISVLQSLGATKQMIRRIFLLEGGMISVLGFLIGLFLAIIFYWLQTTIGIINVPDGYSIKSYPMVMRMSDVLVICATVLTMGFLASIPAAGRAVRVSAFVRTE